MEMRLQAIQPLPYHAGLAAHLPRRLQAITAFSACSCPLHLSMSGEPLTQKHSSQFLPAAPGIRQCATRRTLSPRRRSRTSLKPYISHALGGLFVPLWEFVTPCPILGDAFSPHSWVFVTYSLSLARISIVIRRSANGSARDRLGTGLQAMQPSPYHAGLAGPRLLRLLCASRFSAMLLSPSLSASG